MTEEWRDVVGYEGLYQVSNTGLVKSLSRLVKNPIMPNKIIREKLLKPNAINSGHMNCVLSKNLIKKHVLVHRMVALAFIPNPNNYPCVNHIDERPRNNTVENLEWCTHQYNNTYGKHAERIKNTDYKAMHDMATPYTRPVIQMDLMGNVINVWESLTIAANETKTQISKISNCCRKIRKQSNGFKWAYKEGRTCRESFV